MTEPTEAKDTPKTPYIGLVPYDEADAALFFGRDEEKRIVAGNLRASRLTILYGPSGVGKTSLIRAGRRPRRSRAGSRERRGQERRAGPVRDLRLPRVA